MSAEHLKAYRDSLTDEQKEANLHKAQAARILNAQLRQANKHLIKTSYLDSYYWSTLASKYNIRMPSGEEAASPQCIRKYLTKANVSFDVFNEHFTSIGYFLENNPLYSKYAVAGLILELKECCVS